MSITPSLAASQRNARRAQRATLGAPGSLWARARAWNGDERRRRVCPEAGQQRRADDVPAPTRLQRDLSAHQFLCSVELARATDLQRLGMSYLGWSLLVVCMGVALGLTCQWLVPPSSLHLWSLGAASLAALASLVNGVAAGRVFAQAARCRRQSARDARVVAFCRQLPSNTPDGLYASLRAEFDRA